MSEYDIVCACLGVPLFGALAWCITAAMHARHHIDAEKRRARVIADAIETEYHRRDVRRALDRMDLPR